MVALGSQFWHHNLNLVLKKFGNSSPAPEIKPGSSSATLLMSPPPSVFCGAIGRRIKTDANIAKAKVDASFWGTEYIKFLAALAIVF